VGISMEHRNIKMKWLVSYVQIKPMAILRL